ncbi:MAG TPA: hypothetical protein VFJ06_03590 [Halococcus sp.]|nr:hypothetical protein [Halococcus sp.]
MAFGFDPILLAFLALVLLVIVGFYLIIRRTALAYREGTRKRR